MYSTEERTRGKEANNPCIGKGIANTDKEADNLSTATSAENGGADNSSILDVNQGAGNLSKGKVRRSRQFQA